MPESPPYRQAWAQIDLGALAFNVKQLKNRIDPETLFMAVVKADGYGHGAVAIARAAIDAGADWLGVATCEEAFALRAAGIEHPILMFTQPPPLAIPHVIDLGITPLVTDPDFVYKLAGEAQLSGKQARYHLKINTGLNRLGIRPDEVISILRELSELPHVKLEGVCTHFATADIEGDWEASNQLHLFERCVAAIRSEGFDPGIVHAANSAATILMPESHFDMVRCGIAIYGLHPSDATKPHITLKPVMSVYAQAEMVNNIAMGEGVSYGLTWHAEIPCAIITLPLGYADGVPRITSGKLEFLHDGRHFEQVGRICMDHLMVRAMQNDRLSAGATFVMIGEDNGAVISMDEVAQKADTISYEIACGLGQRLDRIYV
ncbi:MAG: alanine racemase [Actinomycetia bacterium]|nr:alanine racemase [Actinomycetes bacterium]